VAGLWIGENGTSFPAARIGSLSKSTTTTNFKYWGTEENQPACPVDAGQAPLAVLDVEISALARIEEQPLCARALRDNESSTANTRYSANSHDASIDCRIHTFLQFGVRPS
jgi:hypothetical protein